MTETERASAWERSQAHEAAGRLSEARDGYRAILQSIEDERDAFHAVSATGGGAMARPPPIAPDYLLERLATVLSSLGDVRPATTFATALLRRMELADNRAGLFRARLLLSRIALVALDLDTAGRHLADLCDDHGRFGELAPAPVSALIERIRRLSLPIGRDTADAVRAEAAIDLARWFASAGRFRPALVLAGLAHELAGTAGGSQLRSRREIALWCAELHLDCGEVAEARAIEQRELAATSALPMSRDLALRHDLISARREALAGRPDVASRILRRLMIDPAGSAVLRVQAAWTLVQVLMALNRLSEANAQLAELRRAADSDEQLAPWMPRIAALSTLLARRRSDAEDRLALPFLPEQVWELSALPSAEAALSPAVETTKAPEAASPTRRFDRFADECADRCNRILGALSADRTTSAETEWLALAPLRGTDSVLWRARIDYYRALVDYRRREFAAAARAIEPCIAAARALALPLEEWRYRSLAGWCAAQLGQEADYQAHAAAAKALLDGVVVAMDRENARLFMLNKMTARDEYLSGLILHSRRSESDPPPTSRWARWRRRHRSTRSRLEAYCSIAVVARRDVERPLESAAAGSDAAATPPPDVAAAVTVDQVERWIRTELALSRRTRQSARGGLPWTSPWLLWHIPADRAVVHFHAVADHLYVFTLARREIRIDTVPVRRSDLYELVAAVLFEIRQEAEGKGAPSALGQALQRLFSVTGLAPILAALPSRVRRLTIVPHDVLVNVPFAVLPFRGRPLCHGYDLNQVPGPGFLVPRAHNRPHRFSGIAMSYEGMNLPSLANTFGEVGAVARLLGLGPKRSVILRDGEAQLEAVVAAFERGNWVHVGCHGRFAREAPHSSCLLVASPDPRIAAEMSLARLQRAHLERLDLAVLAACWAGETAVLPGSELVCLPAAFLRAGARAVMAPLWPVDDAQCARFMSTFYGEAARRGPAAGLAAAQRRWSTSESLEQRLAFHWGAWAIHGSG